MKFDLFVSDIHVHLHIKPDREVLSRIDALSRKLDLVLKTERRMENTMALDFTKMIAAAARQEGVKNSTLQVLTDLRAKVADISTQLAAANAANDPTAQKAAQDQLDALAQGIEANDDAIAAAVEAPGTPGTPGPTPTPGPGPV